MYWDLYFCQVRGLSCRTYQVHLKRMCILSLFNVVFYLIYHVGQNSWYCCSNLDSDFCFWFPCPDQGTENENKKMELLRAWISTWKYAQHWDMQCLKVPVTPVWPLIPYTSLSLRSDDLIEEDELKEWTDRDPGKGDTLPGPCCLPGHQNLTPLGFDKWSYLISWLPWKTLW